MFTFFRRIRKGLLESNTLQKYLLYAIGEIALVVIGILLALQINTWNNEQNLRKKEKVYLKEITVNLEDDLKNILHTLDFNEKKDSIISVCMQSILNSESNYEAGKFIREHMYLLAEFSVFTQNSVAFENMISAENIDIISSDSIRTLLSSYYREQQLNDGTQERVKQLTRKFVDNISPMLMNKESIKSQFGVENEFISSNQINFKTNPVLFGDLYSMKQSLKWHSVFLLNFKKDIEKLIQIIENFLS
jgi:hypothetical protein